MKKSTLSQDADNLLAEINIVPYVDVVLVLLVIFMITAPIVQQGVSVDLPKTAPNSTLETPNMHSIPIIIIVSKEGLFIVKGYKDVESTSSKAIAKVVSSSYGDKNQPIYIQGDRSAAYGKIVNLFVQLRNVGFKKVQLITRPDDRA